MTGGDFACQNQYSSPVSFSSRKGFGFRELADSAQKRQTGFRSELASEPAHGRPVKGPGNEQWGKYRQEQLDKYQADRLDEKKTKDSMNHNSASSPAAQKLLTDRIYQAWLTAQLLKKIEPCFKFLISLCSAG